MGIKLRGNSFVFLNCPPVHSKWSGADLKAAGPSGGRSCRAADGWLKRAAWMKRMAGSVVCTEAAQVSGSQLGTRMSPDEAKPDPPQAVATNASRALRV